MNTLVCSITIYLIYISLISTKSILNFSHYALPFEVDLNMCILWWKLKMKFFRTCFFYILYKDNLNVLNISSIVLTCGKEFVLILLFFSYFSYLTCWQRLYEAEASHIYMYNVHICLWCITMFLTEVLIIVASMFNTHMYCLHNNYGVPSLYGTLI